MTHSPNITIIDANQVAGASLDTTVLGPQATMTLLGGQMVEEYDRAIQIFSAELMGINAEKSNVNSHKADVMRIVANKKKITSETDGVSKSAYVITGTEYQKLVRYAGEYGVALNGVAEGSVPESFIEELKDAIDNKIQELNSTSELRMINFQSLMDGRKQAMMMLSNMLNSDNQTKMSIIQNFKS